MFGHCRVVVSVATESGIPYFPMIGATGDYGFCVSLALVEEGVPETRLPRDTPTLWGIDSGLRKHGKLYVGFMCRQHLLIEKVLCRNKTIQFVAHTFHAHDVCMQRYVQSHTYIHTYVHAYIHACRHADMQTCIHAGMQTCVQKCVHMYKSARIHLHCTLMFMFIYVYIYVYIYIHAHAYPPNPDSTVRDPLPTCRAPETGARCAPRTCAWLALLEEWGNDSDQKQRLNLTSRRSELLDGRRDRWASRKGPEVPCRTVRVNPKLGIPCIPRLLESLCSPLPGL